MATFLFDKVVFGPVTSRRLGRSLGINLLPSDSKYCNFNCIYCECGWTDEENQSMANLPSRNLVASALETFLKEMPVDEPTIDAITFAGNGEPTLHPEFKGIIDDTILLRNRYCPPVRIAVLSNGSTAGDTDIREALMKCDRNILKLDSAFDETVNRHNIPGFNYSSARVLENYRQFKGSLIIQTLFVQGRYKGEIVDNTTDREVGAWIDAIKELSPVEVMIYTISRDTPLGNDLQKVSPEKLFDLAEKVKKLGIEVSVST